MLYRKKIEPCCAYCRHGCIISEEEVICSRRGVVDIAGSCGKFSYDPLKREPAHPKLLETEQFSPEDFQL